MPAVRRSSTRAALAAAANISEPVPTPATEEIKTKTNPRKRKAATELVKDVQRIPKPDTVNDKVETAITASASATVDVEEDQEKDFVPAVLTFNFDDAKEHLIQVDSRFEDLFSKMPCKPFEHLEQVHPFRYEA